MPRRQGEEDREYLTRMAATGIALTEEHRSSMLCRADPGPTAVAHAEDLVRGVEDDAAWNATIGAE